MIALVVIVILNDATIISIAYDHVVPSQLPERWNLPVLFVVAGWIGLVACFSSLLLLQWALDSEDPASPIRQLGVSEPLSYGQIVAMMYMLIHPHPTSLSQSIPFSLPLVPRGRYLKISLSDWWTIFAARTQGFFTSRAPSRIVFAAASFATCVSTIFSVAWPFQHERFETAAYIGGEEQPDAQLVGLTGEHVLFTWIYTILWFLVQDGCKVVCYRVLYFFDVCGIRTEAEANKERVAKNRSIQSSSGDLVEPTPAAQAVTRSMGPA